MPEYRQKLTDKSLGEFVSQVHREPELKKQILQKLETTLLCALVSLWLWTGAAAQEQIVRVASYNSKFLSTAVSSQGDRRAKLQEVITRLDADVIGLQEIMAPCSNAQPYGDIGRAWRSLPQPNPLGCPLEAETGGTDGFGRSQRFAHGQVTWSAPSRGDHATLVAYQAGNAIELQWAGLEPRQYHFFIVRMDKNGQNVMQVDVRGEPSAGWYVARNLTPGATYSFVVEGCKEVGFFGTGAKSRCRQGWMNRVHVTMTANPAKPAPTLPDPPARGSSCFVQPDCVLKYAEKAFSVGATVIKAFAGGK